MITRLALACGIPIAVMLALAALRRRYLVVTVTGGSMAPSLRPDDRVLVRRGCPVRLRRGAVIVLLPPPPGRTAPALARWAVKRVAATPGDIVPEPVRRAVNGVSVVPEGMLVVLADNPGGTDSRLWGFVPISDVLGIVVMRRAGRGRWFSRDAALDEGLPAGRHLPAHDELVRAAILNARARATVKRDK